MEILVRQMQSTDSGVPVRCQKLFLTTIPSAFMGKSDRHSFNLIGKSELPLPPRSLVRHNTIYLVAMGKSEHHSIALHR